MRKFLVTISSLILVIVSCFSIVGCKKKDESVKGFENQVQTVISDNYYVKMKLISASSDTETIREFARVGDDMTQLYTARALSDRSIIEQNKRYIVAGTQYLFDYYTKSYTVTNVNFSSYIVEYTDKKTGKNVVNNQELNYVCYSTSPLSKTYFYRSKDKIKYWLDVSDKGEFLFEVITITKKIPQSAGCDFKIPTGYTRAN